MLFTRAALMTVALASKDKSRVHLQGINVRADGTVEATTGMAAIKVVPAPSPMAEADWPAETGGDPVTIPDTGFILPADVAKDALKGIPKSSRFPVLAHARLESLNGTARLVTTDLSTTRRHEGVPLEGRFPDIDKVAPTGKVKHHVRLDASLVARVCDTIASMHGGHGLAGASFDFFEDTGVVRITCELPSGETAIALVCDVRE